MIRAKSGPGEQGEMRFEEKKRNQPGHRRTREAIGAVPLFVL